MVRIAVLIGRRRRAVLAATAIVTLLALGMLFRLRFNADVGGFVTEGNAAGEAWVTLQEKYNTADPINVLAELADGESFLTREGALGVPAGSSGRSTQGRTAC